MAIMPYYRTHLSIGINCGAKNSENSGYIKVSSYIMVACTPLMRVATCVITLMINPVSGVTYTRWGKTTCPTSTGAELVYSGRIGATRHNIEGGSAEKLCLPDDPDYIPETADVTVTLPSRIYGVEYEFFVGPLANATEHNAPCAICFVPTRASVIMIPAKTVCPSSWTREYYGYLTTELDSDTHHRSSFTCLDNSAEEIPGTRPNTGSAALLYYTISTCHGLSCPPYENDRIVSCVVCTK